MTEDLRPLLAAQSPPQPTSSSAEPFNREFNDAHVPYTVADIDGLIAGLFAARRLTHRCVSGLGGGKRRQALYYSVLVSTKSQVHTRTFPCPAAQCSAVAPFRVVASIGTPYVCTNNRTVSRTAAELGLDFVHAGALAA